MRKKITISLDEKLIWQLRHKQSDLMLDTNQDVSLSRVTYILIQNAIKAEKVRNSQLEQAASTISESGISNGTYPMTENGAGFPKNLESARR